MKEIPAVQFSVNPERDWLKQTLWATNGTMSSLNVKVLEKSFAGIKPYATQFASRFYYNLFTDNPQLEPLFANTNMQEQDKKLIDISKIETFCDKRVSK